MDQKQQIVDRLKQANNVLVTVSNSPSVDQLAACVGLTVALNKMGKHATAVFSGAVPSTLEFLKPEETLEPNTDSLRDFIISLDKAKADKLRYKVEDKVVKIFITPYRTSITGKDLEFSQGDFNVDVVVALGVHAQAELDQAITSHGRILHDAAVVTVNVKPGGDLGAINWLEEQASSLSELSVELVEALDKSLIDSQVATALLTGIVAETGRFGNEKTSPVTMSISADLMAAGANQQLVASKLEGPAPALKAQAPASAPAQADGQALNSQPAVLPESPKPNDGTLEIAHTDKPGDAKSARSGHSDTDEKSKNEEDPSKRQIDIDEHGSLRTLEEMKEKSEAKATTDPTQHMGSSHMILQPPTMGSAMSAMGMPDDGYASADPLSLPPPSEQPSGAPMPSPSASDTAFGPSTPPLSHTPLGAQPASPAPLTPPTNAVPLPAPLTPPIPASSLGDTPGALSVPPASTPSPTPPVPSVAQPDESHITNARDAVMQAISGQPGAPEPIRALNAQPLGDPLHAPAAVPGGLPQPAAPVSMPVAPPPPVPPPMMPTSP